MNQWVIRILEIIFLCSFCQSQPLFLFSLFCEYNIQTTQSHATVEGYVRGTGQTMVNLQEKGTIPYK